MSSTRTALLFSFVEKYGLLALSIGASMVLARLLTPADTGIYSVGAVLLGVAQVLRDFGVGQYLIQQRELDEGKLRAVLATSILCAWSLGLLIAAASAPIAAFYHEPRLRNVLQLLAINFLLIPMSALTLPLLRRQLRFGAICAINLCGGLTNVLVAVTLASLGFGYLSLALASVGATLASTAAALMLRPPGLPWLPACKGMGAVFRFGSYATGGTLIDEAGVAAPDLIIGRALGMDAVGLFGKALAVLAVFNQAMTSAISPVIFALFAAHAREQRPPAGAYLLTVRYLTAFALPFFGFLGLNADPIVHLLYGNQWNAAIVLIQIMCCSAAIYSMFSMARYLFVAAGHVKAQAKLDALAVPVRVLALLVAAPFGLTALAWAVVAGSLFRSWLTCRYLRQLAGIRFGALLRASATSLVLAFMAVGVPGALLLAGEVDGPRRLAWSTAAAVLVWGGGVFVLRHPIGQELSLAWRKQFVSLARR